MYEVKNSKICNFWTFWPVLQLINHLCQIRQKVPVRFWKDGIITELSTKISRSAVFASCIARILKACSKTSFRHSPPYPKGCLIPPTSTHLPNTPPMAERKPDKGEGKHPKHCPSRRKRVQKKVLLKARLGQQKIHSPTNQPTIAH